MSQAEPQVVPNDDTKTAAFENYPNNPLMSGVQAYAAVATGAGGAKTQMVEVQGAEELTVEAKLTTATAAGDLAVSVFPVFSDGTVSTAALSPIRSTGPTLSASSSFFYAQYDVSGANRVVISSQNNNAAPQNITLNWSQS